MSATLEDRIDLCPRLSPSADRRWNGDGTTWNAGRFVRYVQRPRAVTDRRKSAFFDRLLKDAERP
jgi:hypothetical protein